MNYYQLKRLMKSFALRGGLILTVLKQCDKLFRHFCKLRFFQRIFSIWDFSLASTVIEGWVAVDWEKKTKYLLVSQNFSYVKRRDNPNVLQTLLEGLCDSTTVIWYKKVHLFLRNYQSF